MKREIPSSCEGKPTFILQFCLTHISSQKPEVFSFLHLHYRSVNKNLAKNFLLFHMEKVSTCYHRILLRFQWKCPEMVFAQHPFHTKQLCPWNTAEYNSLHIVWEGARCQCTLSYYMLEDSRSVQNISGYYVIFILSVMSICYEDTILKVIA